MTAPPSRRPVYEGYFADPFVLRVGECYYAYGTGGFVDGRAFEVLASEDLRSWRCVGGALEPLDVPGGDRLDYWAPEVAAREGRFYLYFSAGRGDVGHKVRVAVADDPAGPFRDQGLELTPDELFAIDASPFRDDDGSWYLYYACDVLDGERVGTMLAAARLVEMTKLGEARRPLLRPRDDWQIYQRQRPMYGQVYDWHTLEGPFVVRRQGRYWLFFSTGSWQADGYAMSYAVANAPLGPFTEAGGNRPSLLASVPGQVRGPGHCSVVVGPDGRDHLVYHAWNEDATARQMHVEPLRWTPEGPSIDDA